MNSFRSHLLTVGAFAASCFFSASGYAESLNQADSDAAFYHNSSSSSSSSHHSGHTFTHPIVLDLEDGFWNQFTDNVCAGVDNSIETQLQITIIGHKVYIKTPQLNFTIPATEDSCYLAQYSVPPQAGGYVYLKDGFLPCEVRPDTVVPLSFPMQSAGLELQIDREGRIKISGPGFTPIAPGGYSLLPTTVSYIVQHSYEHAPKNVAISKTQSTPNAMTYPGQFSETQQASFQNNVVAFTYADNSVHPDQPSCFAAIGKIVDKDGCPTIQLTSNKAVIVPDPFVYGYCVAGAGSGITINPTNTQNIVLMSPQINNVPLTDAFPYDRYNIHTSYTTDGGANWSPQVRFDDTALTAMRTDPRIASDPVGNHWIIYGNRGPSYNDATDTGTSMRICVSSDEGATWTQVAEVLPPNTNSFGFDYPMLHWGGDGSGGMAMYFSWTFHDVDGSGNAIFRNYLAAIPVDGLGGPFGPITVINNFPQLDGFVAFGEIMATPDGTLVYAAPDVGPHSGFGVPPNGLEAHSYLSVALSGLNSFTPAGFSAPRLVDYTTIGMNNAVRQHNVSWQIPNGIVPSIGNQGLAFDPNSGRLYALSLTELNPQTVTDPNQACKSNNMAELNLRWTTDFGQTWSEVVPIRDCTLGQVGIANINVDPKTSNIAVGWYDPRGDAKNQQMIRWYGTVLYPPDGTSHSSSH